MAGTAMNHSAACNHDDAESCEELLQLRRWMGLLPCAVSSAVLHNGIYVRSRSATSGFFEATRGNLQTLLGELSVAKASAYPLAEAEGQPVRVLRAVLEAQWVANGYMTNGEFYRARDLHIACLDLVEALDQTGSLPQGAFWRTLCHMAMGATCAHQKKSDEAISWLDRGLAFADMGTREQGAVPGNREKVLSGACYSYLSKIHLEQSVFDEALRFAEACVNTNDQYLFDLLDEPIPPELLDHPQLQNEQALHCRRTIAAVMATAYMNRGICEVHRRNWEQSLACFKKAQESLQANVEPGSAIDTDELMEKIKEHVEHVKDLQI